MKNDHDPGGGCGRDVRQSTRAVKNIPCESRCFVTHPHAGGRRAGRYTEREAKSSLRTEMSMAGRCSHVTIRCGSMERLDNYVSVSAPLARLTDEELSALVAKAPPLHAGVGGRSVLLTIDSTPIFVKSIALTDLERRQEHVLSTANLFDIPLSCHYGLGGPGFSAWRELAASVIAHGWVLSGACANFPLLYHWRVLPSDLSTPISKTSRPTADVSASAISAWRCHGTSS
jgi:hypothetical protein